MLTDIVIGGVFKPEAAFVEPGTGVSMNPVRSVSPALVFGQLSGIWLYLMATTLEAAYTEFTAVLPKVHSAVRTNPWATPNIPSENLYTAVRTG